MKKTIGKIKKEDQAYVNPSYDKSLSVRRRLGDFLGAYHVSLNGVVPHERYVKHKDDGGGICCSDHPQEIIEFVERLIEDQKPSPTPGPTDNCGCAIHTPHCECDPYCHTKETIPEPTECVCLDCKRACHPMCKKCQPPTEEKECDCPEKYPPIKMRNCFTGGDTVQPHINCTLPQQIEKPFTFQDHKKELLKDPEVRKAYDLEIDALAKGWEDIDEIFTKHTVALTREKGVVSLDTVVLNIYEANKDLVKLIEQARTQAFSEAIGMLEGLPSDAEELDSLKPRKVSQLIYKKTAIEAINSLSGRKK